MKKTAILVLICVLEAPAAVLGADMSITNGATQDVVAKARQELLERYGPRIATNMVVLGISREDKSSEGPFYGSKEAQDGDVIWIRMKRTDDELTTTNGPSIHNTRTVVRIAMRPDGRFISIKEQREEHFETAHGNMKK